MEAKLRICEACGNTVKASNEKHSKATLCRTCYDTQGIEARTRVCIDCGDVKVCETVRDAEAERCKKCSNLERAKTRKGSTWKKPKIRYWYFCQTCPSIQEKRIKRGGCQCQKCSVKYRHTLRKQKIIFDFDTMKMEDITPVKVKTVKKYIVTCPDCPKSSNTREVTQSAYSKYGANCRCKKCAVLAKPRSYTKGMKPKKSRTTSPEAIKRQAEINRKHREREEAKPVVVQSVKTDEQMMAEFLAHHKPSVVIDPDEEIPHFVGTITTSHTSILGG